MVKLEVHICATLENINDLHLTDEDDWNFRVKCTNCDQDFENTIYFNLVDQLEIEGSRGKANFISKCKVCSQKAHIEYVPGSIADYSDSEKFGRIATFECRNIEIT